MEEVWLAADGGAELKGIYLADSAVRGQVMERCVVSHSFVLPWLTCRECIELK